MESHNPTTEEVGVVDPISLPLFYIIEHFETEVSNWTLSEYVHMIMILNDLYADSERSDKTKLIVTNFPFIH